MTRAERVVATARAMAGAGVRFRLHGRVPEYGLDCVGLAAVAFAAAGFRGAIPAGYALRGGDPDGFARAIDVAGLRRVAAAAAAAGDLLLCDAGPAQFHLAILVPGGVVHADALLRRVVERPGPCPWRVLGAWRMEEE